MSAESCRKPRTPTFGFATTATAPASMARSAVSVPRAASPEQTTTGMGSVAMTESRKERPSMPGISRSRTITLGR